MTAAPEPVKRCPAKNWDQGNDNGCLLPKGHEEKHRFPVVDVEAGYRALREAIAEVGRCFEALPYHSRTDQIRALLAELPERQREDLLFGTFMVAHDMRLGIGPGGIWPTDPED